jgi:hypothetical protein
VHVDPYLKTAAALAFAVGLLHSWLGERYILIRLFRRRNLPQLFGGDVFTKRTLRFAWHLTTLAWWGFAVLLLGASARAPLSAPDRGMAAVIGGTFLVSGVYAFVATRGRHLSWVIFLGIALATWLAIR